MKKNEEARLVYSSDPKLNKKCPRCKELESECQCEKNADINNLSFTAVLRMEKSGRGGKIVTVIDKLPKNEIFLSQLTTKLKKKCGTGGTFLITDKSGVIEIQGDKREQIRDLLNKDGIKNKG